MTIFFSMLRRSARIGTAFLLLLLLRLPALAWWDSGHVVIADIAWDNLDSPTQEEIRSLLRSHPDPSVTDMIRAATWPDEIKSPAHPFHSYDRPDWHYQNNLITSPSPQGFEPGSRGKLVASLQDQIRVLADRRRSPSERAVALAWLVHLVGDVHQPLHNSDYFSEDFPRGDAGGNRFHVKLGQRSLSLHVLWDSAGGRFLDKPPDFRLRSYSRWFQEEHPPETFSAELAVSDPVRWSQEGLAVAKEVAYSGVAPEAPVDEAYLRRVLDVTEERMALGGYRLARLLTRALARSPGSETSPDLSSPSR